MFHDGTIIPSPVLPSQEDPTYELIHEDISGHLLANLIGLDRLATHRFAHHTKSVPLRTWSALKAIPPHAIVEGRPAIPAVSFQEF